jgi:hypothetical protein
VSFTWVLAKSNSVVQAARLHGVQASRLHHEGSVTPS